ncbi:ATP-binding protein [Paraburkholderia sp. J12]|uniref:ATP-binding protein n=1 Tax=Paraburkholderia sp. J12 TaxID=2805432 RepID=UPI002ABD2AFD|nr:ATP-binding protein [Paraburkholderia sp. J12]
MSETADTSIAEGERSIAVGGSVVQSYIATGNNATFFIGQYEQLASLYISPQAVFERVRLSAFRGRDWLTSRIDSFLCNNKSGYIVVEAEAGLGKTAFLAHLVRERGYIHHFIELARGAAGIDAGLKSLAAQLVRVWDLQPFARTNALPAMTMRPDFLDSLLRLAADRRNELRPGEPIVMVIDALDESDVSTANGNVMGLPRVLPDGVFLIVSQRPVHVALSTEATRERLRIDARAKENRDDIHTFLMDAALSNEKIASALRSGNIAPHHFVQTLLAKSEGVWIYLHYVIAEIERDHRAPLDLARLPDGLWQYYGEYWWPWLMVPKVDEFNCRLLCTLSAHEGDLTADFFCKLWGESDASRVDALLTGDWRPFVSVAGGKDGAPQGYRLYHASLRDFVHGRVDDGKLGTQQQKLVRMLASETRKAHKRLADYYLDGWGGLDAALRALSDPHEPGAGDDHGMKYVTAHLEMAGQASDLHKLLDLRGVTTVWPQDLGLLLRDLLRFRFGIRYSQLSVRHRYFVWYAARKRQGEIGGFLTDVRRAWRLAERLNADLSTDCIRADAIGLQCRYALISASINSLAANVPPQLMLEALRKNLRSAPYALAYARRAPWQARRAMLAAIGLWHAESGRIHEAFAIASEIGWPVEPLLVSAVSYLSPVTIRQAFELASMERDALPALLGRLAELDDPEEALRQTDRLLPPDDSPKQRIQALAKIAAASHLSRQREIAATIVQEARRLEEPESRARALSLSIPYLSGEDRNAIRDEAIQTARALVAERDYDRRSKHKLLIDIAAFLTEAERIPFVDELQQAALEYDYSDLFSLEILSALLKIAPASHQQAILNKALAIGRRCSPDKLATLALYMTQTQRRKAFFDALGHAQASERYETLNELAPYMGKEMATRALKSLETIGDQSSRAALPWLWFAAEDYQKALAAVWNLARTAPADASAVLCACIDQLPPQYYPRVLKIASKLTDNEVLAVLRTIAKSLPPALISAAIKLAKKISDKDRRSDAYEALASAPSMSDACLNDLVGAARKFSSRIARIRALAKLVPYLSGDAKSAAQIEVAATMNSLTPQANVYSWSSAPYTLARAAGCLEDPDRQRMLRAELLGAMSGDLTAYWRDAQLKELLPQLTMPLLEEAVEIVNQHLSGAGPLLESLYRALQKNGLPEDLLATLQSAKNPIDWMNVWAEVEPVSRQGEHCAEIAVLSGKLLALDGWVATLMLIAVRFGALGETGRALEIISHVVETDAFRAVPLAYEADMGLNQLIHRRIEELAPYLETVREVETAVAIADRHPAWDVDHHHQLTVRFAQLGCYDTAIERALSALDGFRGGDVLIAIVPLLPDKLLLGQHPTKRRSVEQRLSAFEYHLAPLSDIATRHDDRYLTRPLLETALVAALDIRSSSAGREKQMAALRSLVPVLLRLDRERLYDLWCKALGLMATGGRDGVIWDLAALAPVLKALGGREAVLEAITAVEDVVGCIP